MLYLLHVPTCICIASALAIGILPSGAVLLGRLGTNQNPWRDSPIIVVGVIIGAQLGSILSQRTPRIVLRRVLAVVILATGKKKLVSMSSNSTGKCKTDSAIRGKPAGSQPDYTARPDRLATPRLLCFHLNRHICSLSNGVQYRRKCCQLFQTRHIFHIRSNL